MKLIYIIMAILIIPSVLAGVVINTDTGGGGGAGGDTTVNLFLNTSTYYNSPLENNSNQIYITYPKLINFSNFFFTNFTSTVIGKMLSDYTFEVVGRSLFKKATVAHNYTYIGDVTEVGMFRVSQEFLTVSASVMDPFLGTAVSSGTISAIAPNSTVTNVSHLGVARILDSTTIGGGYTIALDTVVSPIYGNETFRIIFMPNSGKRNTTSYRLGWSDSAVLATAPTDGCWFNVSALGNTVNNSLTGNCRAGGGAIVATGTRFNLTDGKWYHALIKSNTLADNISFIIYNDTGVKLWEENVSFQIPNRTGTDTGIRVIAGESTVDAGLAILDIDYIEWTVNRSFYR